MRKSLILAVATLLTVCAQTNAYITNNVNIPGFTLIAEDTPDGGIRLGYQGSTPLAIALTVTLPNHAAAPQLMSLDNHFNVFPDFLCSSITDPYLGFPHPFASSHGGALSGAASRFSISMGCVSDYPAIDFTKTPIEPFKALVQFDLNGDGYVNSNDLLLFSENWLGSGMGDFNRDERVDMQDLGLMNGMQILPPAQLSDMITFYLNGYNPQTDELILEVDALRGGIYLVPEPVTLVILGLGGLTLRFRKP